VFITGDHTLVFYANNSCENSPSTAPANANHRRPRTTTPRTSSTTPHLTVRHLLSPTVRHLLSHHTSVRYAKRTPACEWIPGMRRGGPASVGGGGDLAWARRPGVGRRRSRCDPVYRRAHLVDDQQHGVAVAVQPHLAHRWCAGRLALHPQPLPAARVVVPPGWSGCAPAPRRSSTPPSAPRRCRAAGPPRTPDVLVALEPGGDLRFRLTAFAPCPAPRPSRRPPSEWLRFVELVGFVGSFVHLVRRFG